MANTGVTIKADWKLSGIFKADPNAVAEEIYSIGDTATTKQIVDKGRNPDTELHKCFDWNDTTAAEKWRTKQAGDILRNLVIVRVENDVPEKTSIRLMHSIPEQRSYKPTMKIIRNQSEYESLLQSALRELTIFKEKYKTLSELNEIFSLIDEL